jgi:hypothetical protein
MDANLAVVVLIFLALAWGHGYHKGKKSMRRRISQNFKDVIE